MRLTFDLPRVSVKGHTSEARNATAAWAGMYEGVQSSARGVHGPRLFGLAHPQVLKLLQQLPGAARCENYKAWHGRAPDVPPMVGPSSHLLPYSHAPVMHLSILRMQAQSRETLSCMELDAMLSAARYLIRHAKVL